MAHLRPTSRDVLVGLVATIISSFTSCQIQEMSLNQQRQQLEQNAKQTQASLEQEFKLKMEELNQGESMKKEDEEAKLKQNQQESEAERETWMLKRVDEEAAANQQLANSQKGQYFSLGFTNQCDELVYAAVAYIALDNTSSVRGWLTIAPGDSSSLVRANTPYRKFHFYAKSKTGKWGDGENDIPFEVSDNRFEYVNDSYFQLGWLKLPGNSYTASFRVVTIPDGTPFGPYYVPLTCPKSN